MLFLGMDGAFSAGPLQALLEAGCGVAAVVIPRLPEGLRGEQPAGRLSPPARRLPARALPLAAPPPPPSIVGVAQARGIPMLEVDSRALAAPHTLAALGDLAPTVVCVACFPRLLPPPLLALAPHGALNVHPSLLPAYRGPSPLFWIFHDGLEHAGVTVHLMDEQADSGPILAQSPLALPDGLSYAAAERLCAQLGGRLLVEVVRALHEGTARPSPQPPVAGPRAPSPREEDCMVTPAWPARRAFNFIRGLSAWAQPITLLLPHGPLTVASAVSFTTGEHAGDGRTAGAHTRHGPDLTVQCTPGTLTVTVAGPQGV